MVLQTGFQMFGKTRLYVAKVESNPNRGVMTLERIKGVSKGRALSRKDSSVKFHFSRDDGQTTMFSIVYPNGIERYFSVVFDLRQTDTTIDPWTEWVRITRENNGNFLLADEELSNRFERVATDVDCYATDRIGHWFYLDNPTFDGYFTKETVKNLRDLKEQDEAVEWECRQIGSEHVCYGT